MLDRFEDDPKIPKRIDETISTTTITYTILLSSFHMRVRKRSFTTPERTRENLCMRGFKHTTHLYPKGWFVPARLPREHSKPFLSFSTLLAPSGYTRTPTHICSLLPLNEFIYSSLYRNISTTTYFHILLFFFHSIQLHSHQQRI